MSLNTIVAWEKGKRRSLASLFKGGYGLQGNCLPGTFYSSQGYSYACFWYSAKRAGVKRACPSKVMAHIWFMHDAHLGRAFSFLDMLAEYTLLSMTVMVAPCLWYVVGMRLVCPMSKFPQAPFARAPFGECRCLCPRDSEAPSEQFRARSLQPLF